MAPGDLVILDFGAVYSGYHSDMTRTVVLGKPDKKQEEIYQLVLAAQVSAIEFLRAGVKAQDVDAAARSIIEQAGYGNQFGHSTGHGVGLSIHEKPRLSVKDQTVLEEDGRYNRTRSLPARLGRSPHRGYGGGAERRLQGSDPHSQGRVIVHSINLQLLFTVMIINLYMEGFGLDFYK